MNCKYYVYLIKNPKNTIYTGYTTDLENRMKQHNKDLSGYTKGKGPWELVWYAGFEKEAVALEFERYLKSGSGFAFARKRFL